MVKKVTIQVFSKLMKNLKNQYQECQKNRFLETKSIKGKGFSLKSKDSMEVMQIRLVGHLKVPVNERRKIGLLRMERLETH